MSRAGVFSAGSATFWSQNTLEQSTRFHDYPPRRLITPRDHFFPAALARGKQAVPTVAPILRLAHRTPRFTLGVTLPAGPGGGAHSSDPILREKADKRDKYPLFALISLFAQVRLGKTIAPPACRRFPQVRKLPGQTSPAGQALE